jgi:lipopolysaccharide transport system permease protein
LSVVTGIRTVLQPSAISGWPEIELLRLLRRHRALLAEMVRRELTQQYAGQVFGALWAIGHPLVQTGVYVFLFAVVFNTKIGGTYELPLDYTTYLLSGLLAWIAVQQSLTLTSTAISANASLVKQVVFPIEILPLKSVISSLVPQLIGTAGLVVYVFATHGAPPLTYLLLPVLVACQCATMAGIGFLLAACGAFLRDLKDVVQVFALINAYLIPVFYLPSWVPRLFQPIIYVNPFSYMIWCYQDVLYFGRFEHPAAWPVFWIGGFLLFGLGYRAFRHLKPSFGNVL